MGHPQENNSDRVQACLDNAAQCEQRAASATDRSAHLAFTDAARCWRELA
jgi:hypothetical protein